MTYLPRNPRRVEIADPPLDGFANLLPRRGWGVGCEQDAGGDYRLARFLSATRDPSASVLNVIGSGTSVAPE